MCTGTWTSESRQLPREAQLGVFGITFIDHRCFTSTFLITYHCVCNQSNTTGATSGAETPYPCGAHEFITSFSGVCLARSLFIISVCRVPLRSLFVLLSFFIWPLCCLSFFELRILITPLVSHNWKIGKLNNLNLVKTTHSHIWSAWQPYQFLYRTVITGTHKALAKSNLIVKHRYSPVQFVKDLEQITKQQK